jgi:hypothetical protein
MSGPRFPIYIPSKSRWASRLTVKALDKFGLDYRVIVEEEQYKDYAAVISPSRLLVLDPSYQDAYDAFDDLGRSKPLGPGPARNLAWADSIERGYSWHWVMDDNIRMFLWRKNNQRLPAGDGSIFTAMEDFILRYANVGMAGPNYFMFSPSRQNVPPYITGTRIYSCNLIRNDAVPVRWRGRYNEDTDLSLRILKAGWNTVQFNAFLQLKAPTQTLGGGNTEAFYAREGTLAKSRMLVAMHPDVSKLVWRYGRAHHQVDYGQWRNRPLIPLADDAPPPRRWQTDVRTVEKKRRNRVEPKGVKSHGQARTATAADEPTGSARRTAREDQPR